MYIYYYKQIYSKLTYIVMEYGVYFMLFNLNEKNFAWTYKFLILKF